MISVSFYATLVEPAVIKQTKNGQDFSIAKLRTESKMKDGMRESIWEISLFGSMGKLIAECNVGDGFTCIGTMEMKENEWNGRKYTKPQINLTHLGVTRKPSGAARSETAPTQKGTTRTVTSFDPKPGFEFPSSNASSAPSRSNGFNGFGDEDLNGIPF